MIQIFLCDPPMKIGKKGIPVGKLLGETELISDAHGHWFDPDFQGDKELAYYDTEQKKLVRRYGVSDWGKIERYT